VTFHFENAWAPNVMYEIFSQTWGSVINKAWAIEHGDWDGLFTTGWSNNYRRKPAIRFSALDQYKDPLKYPGHGSLYPSGAPDVPGMCGTGPYNFTATNWDQTTKTWRIDAFTEYWGGWAGNHVTTVIEKGIDSWPTRKMLFLNGEFDVIVVPRANMYDLLASPSDPYTPIPGVNLAYNIASLSNDVLLFNMNISATTSYPAYVGYTNHQTGAEASFFANEHIRKAFAWALNYTSYVHDAWFDEAIVQRSWWVDGLSPADFKNENASMPQRNLNYTQMKNELDQAIVDGFNVSTYGFDVTLAYNIGNDQRLIACQLIAQAFLTLGSKYHVNVVGLDWPVFLAAEQAGGLAAYDVGWLADFADPDNFARPYQHSAGDFLSTEGPPFPADRHSLMQRSTQPLLMQTLLRVNSSTKT
jgi:peptide/nickel transport system substrate-binding protein